MNDQLDFCFIQPKESGAQIHMDENLLNDFIPSEINRHKHIIGVVKNMERLLGRITIQEEFKPLLIQSAYLHDIGYSDQLNKKYNFHPLDGAIFAQRMSFSKPIIAAVLFHSCAYKMVHRSRPDLISIYEEHHALLDDIDRLFIDLVTYCDVHTSGTGEPITLSERVQDVVNRYGPTHPISVMMLVNEPHYRATVERVKQLMRSSR